jgi:hypothetical protein
LIVHAEINRRQLLSTFPVQEHKVVVIPHGEYSLDGIAQEMSADKARDMLGIDNRQRTILCSRKCQQTKQEIYWGLTNVREQSSASGMLER